MEVLCGIKFKDFVLVAADTAATFSVMMVNHNCDKIYKLSDNLLLGAVGHQGDSVQFAEFIVKNIQLFRLRNGFELSPKNAATYVQRNLADYLRSRTPYQTNLILAGWDKEKNTSELYWIDYLGTMCEVPYGFHGYPQMFTGGLLDAEYRDDMTEEQGVELLTKCLKQLNLRFVGKTSNCIVKKVDTTGIKTLPWISIKNIA